MKELFITTAVRTSNPARRKEKQIKKGKIYEGSKEEITRRTMHCHKQRFR
jgi:hypothetical protein